MDPITLMVQYDQSSPEDRPAVAKKVAEALKADPDYCDEVDLINEWLSAANEDRIELSITINDPDNVLGRK